MSVFVSLSESPLGNNSNFFRLYSACREAERTTHVAFFVIDRVNIYIIWVYSVSPGTWKITYLIEVRPRHYYTVSHSFGTLLAPQSVSAALYDQIVISSAITSTTEEFQSLNSAGIGTIRGSAGRSE